MSPSGKARAFGARIRRFESSRPSQNLYEWEWDLRLFGGRSNPELTKEVCDYLGIEQGQVYVDKFSDGETRVEIRENVRGRDVFVLQSTCPPVNDHLMELLVMLDAFRRASAKSITAVIPYYGYARQDRKVKPRVPISAKLVADLIAVAGATRVVSMDLHAGQIQGYFNIPVDNIFATPVVLDYLKAQFQNNLVIVSPDAGGVERAWAYARRLNCNLAVIDKRRSTATGAVVSMNIVGDVKDKVAIIVDDIVDTAGTLCKAAECIKAEGAREIYACCVHPVLSGPALENLKVSPIKKVVVTNTIPVNKQVLQSGKIEVLSVARLLGETIRRIYNSESVSTLFV